LFLLLIMVGASACHDDVAAPLPIAGTWSVSKVTCDDVDQPAWLGKTISFKQLSADSGVYEFPNTVYDSIWNKSSSWKMTATNDLVRYDFYPPLACRFNVTNNTLTMVFCLEEVRQHQPSSQLYYR